MSGWRSASPVERQWLPLGYELGLVSKPEPQLEQEPKKGRREVLDQTGYRPSQDPALEPPSVLLLPLPGKRHGGLDPSVDGPGGSSSTLRLGFVGVG